MAAATAADTSTGARRAVVRSEKFMEWQRELSSSRAAYGGRKRYDDAEGVEISGSKKHYGKRHSSDDDAAKTHEGSEEREADGEDPVMDSLAENGAGNQRTKVKKQQQQRQRSDSKRLPKDANIDSKRAVVSQGKDSLDQAEGEGGHVRRCKQSGFQTRHLRHQQQELQSQQVKQQTSLNQAVSRRRQRRMPRSFSLTNERVERGLRSLKRARGCETTPPLDIPLSRGTKRSKRVAQRLAHQEPLPPPLKLPRLHLVLTRKEIQEDWIKITGHKYTGKPRKSTLVQRGLGLCTSLTCPSSIRYLNDPQ